MFMATGNTPTCTMTTGLNCTAGRTWPARLKADLPCGVQTRPGRAQAHQQAHDARAVEVQDDEDAEKDRGRLAGEEERVAVRRVVQEELRMLLGRRLLGHQLWHNPYDQAEERCSSTYFQ